MERYAILIGIDDQDKDGITQCSKDVDDFTAILESHCKFKSKNIFKIQSKYQAENLLALNEFENRIDLLKTENKINSTDILLIYFSGHGEYDNLKQQSFLKFPTTKLSTLKVKEYIDNLHPKHSIVIFDACFIGAKVLSKSFNINKLKRKLHVDSEGVFGIYGSPTEREAYLPKDLGNSLLTYHLIETIKDSGNYDEDSLLSIDNIASICAKKVYKHSIELVKKNQISKEQIIVREGRIEGWLPFAEIAIKTEQIVKTEKEEKQITQSKTEKKVEKIDEEKEFYSLLNGVKNELKKFKPVISAKILSYYSDKPYNPNYDEYKTDINEAIRKEIIDEDGDVRYKNRQVSSLISAIEKLSTFITDTKRTNEFDEFFDNEFNLSPHDNDTQDFWENVYELTIPRE
jgi:hypothetical protein